MSAESDKAELLLLAGDVAVTDCRYGRTVSMLGALYDKAPPEVFAGAQIVAAKAYLEWREAVKKFEAAFEAKGAA